MKSLAAIPLSILTTAFCWGVYAVVMKNGQQAMGNSKLLPFIWVGLAYFVLAVILPSIWLQWYGEKGSWTASGILWSLIAGAAGALGALGIIMALTFGGNPIYVAPLVFGGAPVVNTAVTMYMNKSLKQASPMFLAGLILVIAGASIVLIFRPAGHGGATETRMEEFSEWVKVVGSIALTIFSWGIYGPVLHKGQMAMQGSRLRPLVCVGVSYFVIAVLIPLILRAIIDEGGSYTNAGAAWSFLGGAAGAIGAIGIIMAFNFGGKPIYVMPLVFGLAPIINTFTSMIVEKPVDPIRPTFIAGLIITVIGAVTVLVFAPKGHPPAVAK
ncbi:MAG: hypothetical protein SGJ20_03485 [Planctomycetota bacterium]|nr:hypothetical protein [Planctomycetota bacterium]